MTDHIRNLHGLSAELEAVTAEWTSLKTQLDAVNERRRKTKTALNEAVVAAVQDKSHDIQLVTLAQAAGMLPGTVYYLLEQEHKKTGRKAQP